MFDNSFSAASAYAVLLHFQDWSVVLLGMLYEERSVPENLRPTNSGKILPLFALKPIPAGR